MDKEWKKYSEELPTEGEEVLAYHHKWIDNDFNPRGIRIGFRTDDDFISAYWWDYQDDYISISKAKCESNYEFYKCHIDNTEPEYWKSIMPFKK